jgi:hypothetical protein
MTIKSVVTIANTMSGIMTNVLSGIAYVMLENVIRVLKIK